LQPATVSFPVVVRVFKIKFSEKILVLFKMGV